VVVSTGVGPLLRSSVVGGVEQVADSVADLYLAGYPMVDQLHQVLCSGLPGPKFEQTHTHQL
jgi:hypothetical protein